MKNQTEVRYQALALKMLELVKGEIYEDVIKATEILLEQLKRKGIVN